MKRSYFENRTFNDYRLPIGVAVTSGGAAYANYPHGMQKLDSIWLPRKRVLAVSFPDGTLAELKADGFVKIMNHHPTGKSQEAKEGL